ncbi:MAG: MerC domain-containing protein, partial [Dehalococcoidia bacterium]|nr:MerC domain-containing protein [Dehalococcoidia bacterium]
MTTAPRAAGNVGLVGTVLALCGCLGFPAVIALLSVLGAQWVLAPRFLLPVLTIAVALGLWSLLSSFRRSREPSPWSASARRS